MITKVIRNNSGVDQYVVVKGRQVVLPARTEREMDISVAAKFLETCGVLVSEVLEIGGTYTPKEAALTVWVANMTGDPDAAPEVSAKRTNRGHWEDVKVPNPLKEPRTLSRSMGGAMRENITPSGALEGINEFPSLITIPPYQRREMPSHVARWFLNRDRTGERHQRGAAIESRPPSNFEPDMKWPLDEMRSYLRLIDQNAQAGMSEEQVRKSAQRRKNSSKTDEDYEVRLAKETVMKRLFKRLANPAVRLPSRAEFTEFVTGKVAVTEMTPEMAAELLEAAQADTADSANAG
mgnify:CR=1 FL=1